MTWGDPKPGHPSGFSSSLGFLHFVLYFFDFLQISVIIRGTSYILLILLILLIRVILPTLLMPRETPETGFGTRRNNALFRPRTTHSH